MPDTVKSWIEERRGIHAAASEGPWSWRECPPCKESGREDIQVWSGDENEVVTQWMEAIKDTPVADDANAIVDAHNMFPRALGAIEKVFELLDDPGGTDSWSHTFQGRHSVFADDVRAAIEGAINHD